MALPLAGVDRWSDTRIHSIAGFLRQYELRDPLHANGSQILGLDSLAIPVMNSTPVPAYTTQLCNTGLPFRINVIVWPEFWKDGDIINPTFQLPPFVIVPTDHDGLNNWSTFLATLRQSIEYKITNIEGLPSGVQFHGLVGLWFLFVPMNNLAAFDAHLPPVAGGCKAKLPLKLTKKHCCLTILNEDEQCLRCCIMAHVLKIYWYGSPDEDDEGSDNDLTDGAKRARKEHNKNANLWCNYLENPRKRGTNKNWQPIYKECGVDFSSLPLDRGSSLDDIEALELANPELAIYVYIYKECRVEHLKEDFVLMRRAPPKERQLRSVQIVLLHHGHHWYLVTNFNRLASQVQQEISRMNNNHAMHSCHRCLANFISDGNLRRHLKSCKGIRTEVKPQAARLPSSRQPKDKCEVYFRNAKNTFKLDMIAFSDCEVFRTPCVGKMGATKVVSENRRLASIGYHAISDNIALPDEFQNRMFVDVGDGVDPFVEYIRSLCRLQLFWQKTRQDAQAIAMTPEAWQLFNDAVMCEHCGEAFNSSKDKCKDHDHITGAYRAALCRGCNSKATLPTSLTICTHNSTNYDNHFFILGIARFQNGPESRKGIHEFAGFEKKDDDISISHWKLDVVATSAEKLKCITFGPSRMQLRFIDTCSFLRGSLEKLIEMQSKMYPLKDREGKIIGYDFTSAFPNVTTHHRCTRDIADAGRVQDILKDALRKIPFPYNGMTGPEVWDKPPVLEREHYYDDFARKHISEEDYDTVKTLARKLGMTTFRDYHDQYFEMDYLALCDIFETFRAKYPANLGVDPAHYLGIPGAAMDALLKQWRSHPEHHEGVLQRARC